MASKEAVRVQVSVRGDSQNPNFTGFHAAGHWWPIDFPATHILEDDEGATGFLQVDADTNKAKSLFTLRQKLEQLKPFEGRRKEDGIWSEPGFPIESVRGVGSRNETPPPRAPQLAVVKILDTRDANGVWDSEKNKGVSKGDLAGSNGQGPQGQQSNTGKRT